LISETGNGSLFDAYFLQKETVKTKNAKD